jgi:hypothetical protein
LQYLNLRYNEVADISPLLANGSFGAGDTIDLTYNNLDPYSNEISILLSTEAEVLYLDQNIPA